MNRSRRLSTAGRSQESLTGPLRRRGRQSFPVDQARGEAGEAAVAARTLGELYADCLRLLGSQNLDTMAVRWYGEAGDRACAVATYRLLLEDELPLLGPDHPNTLTTRTSVARWQGRLGYAVGAARTLEVVRDDCLHALGTDDPATLATRQSLANLAREARARQQPVLVTVNNNAEGSAPLSIVQLAAEIVRPT